ncbi:MAG: ABC transporter ATP-binding protein [Spirochaetota bacterium]
MIDVAKIRVAYGAHTVLSDVSFIVPRGTSLAIVGPSGCGKSTLLYALAGLVPAEYESLRVGLDIDRSVGLVLQSYGLFPWYTVLDNVLVGLRIRSKHRGPGRDRALAWLERLGLADKANEFVGALSGGEQQRVALARTLVLEPSVLLLDEPFSALDALTREELQDELLSLLEANEITSIFVTHSIEEAVYLGDRIGVLAGSPATLGIRRSPCPPRGAGTMPSGTDRRTSMTYLKACAAVRRWFAETASA